jgi:soluble lytic murein transglycosylase-like protein
MESIIALIFLIAAEIGVPPNYALAVAMCESGLNPSVISTVNQNGSVDRGLFQLNSYVYPDVEWDDPETNIRLGITHLKWLARMECHNTYWAVAISYNAGHSYLLNKMVPPDSSIDFANKVMKTYTELSGGYVNPVISYRKSRSR